MARGRGLRWLSWGAVALGLLAGAVLGHSAPGQEGNPSKSLPAANEVTHENADRTSPLDQPAREPRPVKPDGSIATPMQPAEQNNPAPDQPAYCRTTADCGLSLACVDHNCVACRESVHCLATETCVRGFCVRREAAGCRSDAECPGDDPCLISGLSPDWPRNNGELYSQCGALRTPEEMEEDDTVEEPIPGLPWREVVESGERLRALSERAVHLNAPQ